MMNFIQWWKRYYSQSMTSLMLPQCWGCRRWLKRGQHFPGDPFLCEQCFLALPWNDHDASCSHCAMPLPNPEHPHCVHCIEQSLYFDQVWSAFRYEDLIEDWVLRFKFGRKDVLAPLMGMLLREALSPILNQVEAPHVVVPIPLHRSRLQQRGFNQASLLAYHSLRSIFPLKPQWLKRIRSTSPQSRLSSKARHHNVKDAFAASAAVAGKSILLLDDVMTTGSTLNEASKALKTAGAHSVKVMVLARRG